MINIIREDCHINPQLKTFPAANANVAIFGTQSSGKSTLLNEVFSTHFPVLDTAVTRERCTKGVWFQNISGLNLIDTEGFDSADRQSHQKMFEKHVALFCLALSDVLIINMWMNEIGRYEASHSHILRAIIKASQKVIIKQQRRIIFVVRDCTDDADRSILREELNTHMMGIVKNQTQKNNTRFTLQYFMMSHYYEAEKAFKKQAKDLFKTISNTKKSNLSNYTDQDRLVYVKNLWEKVTTDSQIDLRTVEDALRNHALQRIKNQTLDFMENWLGSVQNLSKHKTYQRFKEAAAKQARVYYTNSKPKHLRQHQIEPFIQAILQTLDSRQNNHFMTVLLPQEEDRLIEQDYKKKIDILQGSSVMYFKNNMARRREEVEQAYRSIVKGLKEHAKMTRRFNEKIQNATTEYDSYLQHLENVFKIQLETALNEEADKQTKELNFDGNRIKKIVGQLEEKHKTTSKPYFNDIWDRIVYRTSNVSIIEMLKSEGDKYTTVGMGVFMGNQTENIIAFYRKLQSKTQKYLQSLITFSSEEDDTNATLQRFQNIRKLINDLIDAKLIEEAHRFKITLIFVAFLMYFFYSEFRVVLKLMGVGKKRLRNWMWLYTLTLVSMFGIIVYRKRQYFKQFIEPA